ncbi:MAG: GNAT family N-acetyltransferase [Chloroflexi bacterium]|nr:GNAT family N-acetyltransferase [Chloroflexota bacterium]
MITHRITGASKSDGLRALDLSRDLRPLADLIEFAFGAELDQTGNQITREIRSLAPLGPILSVFNLLNAPLSDMLNGFVWVEDRRLVGNVTVTLQRRGVWMISNVAVYPEHRGRGIARQLMEAALNLIEERGGHTVLLQVRSDNQAAQALYRHLGFTCYETTVDLSGQIPAMETKPEFPASTVLRPERAGDWQQLYDLYLTTTSPSFRKYHPVSPRAFRRPWGSGILEALGDWLTGGGHWRLVVEREGRDIVASLSVSATSGGVQRLRLLVAPSERGSLESALVDEALRRLRPWAGTRVACTVPASHTAALEALKRRGFSEIRRLDQMALEIF